MLEYSLNALASSIYETDFGSLLGSDATIQVRWLKITVTSSFQAFSLNQSLKEKQLNCVAFRWIYASLFGPLCTRGSMLQSVVRALVRPSVAPESII